MGLFYSWKWTRRTDKKTAERLYRVTVRIQGIEINTMALYDTGNCLVGGKGRQPVSLLESQLLRANCGQIPLARLHPVLIWFHTVGGDGNMMTIQADHMIITGAHKKMRIRHPRIGICHRNLSLTGEYRMLLHPGHLDRM